MKTAIQITRQGRTVYRNRMAHFAKSYFRVFLLFFGAHLLSFLSAEAKDGAADFTSSHIISGKNPSTTEQAAVDLFRDEVLHRTAISIPVSVDWPDSGIPVIVAGTVSSVRDYLDKNKIPVPSGLKEEGFSLILEENNGKAPTLYIIGKDDRGVLYGVGHVLRKSKMKKGSIHIPRNIDIETSPRYSLRGHQLGYRPKTNSYDGFDVDMWEQYIRDLIVFGANAVELVPPNTDDESTGPMLTLPPEKMLVEMIQLLDKYNLNAWIWYPLMHGDYTNPTDVNRSLDENRRIFGKLPKLDAVFVPGGDPGDAPPAVLFSYLEKKAELLRQFHPDAEMWVSPQGFDQKWMEEFVELLRKEPAWLTGVVHGPQVRMNVDDFRSLVPERYQIRRYPDITHNYDAQYPVNEWDHAYAATQNRESINPRPVDQTLIFRAPHPESFTGFITYCEGVNDDVNKAIWSALGWDPETDYMETLRDYGRYFIDVDYADVFAQGMLQLEQNWRGSLLTNTGVYPTLMMFQEMENNASPAVMLNWRFQMALFRAYYDAYNRRRLIYETQLEEEAMEILGKASLLGVKNAIQKAENILDQVNDKAVAPEWRQRIFELAASLFQSIRMQKSVEKYYAAGARRGGNLDLLDHPLNNRLWLKDRFEEISQLKNEKKQLKAIDELIHWTNPGPGGYYDDLGDLSSRSRWITGDQYEEDPSFLRSAFVGYTIGDEVINWRVSWARYGQTLYGQPMYMKYTDLDPDARYQVKITYVKDLYSGDKMVRLVANEDVEIHDYIEKPKVITPLVWDIPHEATKDGELILRWNSEGDMGGTGRGCQVAEVWLIRKD